jgi:hypothetical protein
MEWVDGWKPIVIYGFRTWGDSKSLTNGRAACPACHLVFPIPACFKLMKCKKWGTEVQPLYGVEADPLPQVGGKILYGRRFPIRNLLLIL